MEHKNRFLVHIYNCKNCRVVFAVDQAFEEQDLVDCPVCLHDDCLEDAGQGEITRYE